MEPVDPQQPRVPSANEQERVREALPMVEKHARELARRLRPTVTQEELLGPGTIGALEAARKYDEDKHPPFPEYAGHYVRGRMLDSIRKDHFSLRARVELAMERGHDIFSSHQIVDVDLFDDPVEEIQEGTREAGDDVLAAAFFAGLVQAKGASPQEVLEQLEGQAPVLALLEAAMGTLDPYEREVIRLVYWEKMTLDEVPEKIGGSERSAQRRHVKALGKLRMYLVTHGMKGAALLEF